MSALYESAGALRAATSLDVARIRGDFPILAQEVNGHPLAYLDNAASAQRPRAVIEAITRCYEEYYSNVHRGVHTLSARSTEAYEGAREQIRRHLGAPSAREIVFVRGTTEAINLVAKSYGPAVVGAGDEVLVTAMEHHSNIVPWQMLCEAQVARLVVAPIDERGDLVVEELERLLGPRTRIVALAQVSNALGTINPVKEVCEMAHRAGAVVLVDGAQAVPHLPVDVVELGCDFFAFSGHKAFGPSGIGALWGRRELLEAMPPWQGGGSMISRVRFERTEYAELPHKFEAGTPAIAPAIGLGAALEYLQEAGLEAVAAWEHGLVEHACEGLGSMPGVRLIGTPRERASVVSFVVEGVHAHDVGTVLDHEGIAVRAGHHCAQPLMEIYGVPATVRASFALYNTHEEADRLIAAVAKTQEMFGA